MANLNLPRVQKDDIGILPLSITTDAPGFRLSRQSNIDALLHAEHHLHSRWYGT